MKKILLLLIGVVFYNLSAYSQGDTPVLYFDFDETTPTFNPGGATYSGVFHNPVLDAQNGSSLVGKCTTGSNTWDGIIFKFENTLDLSQDTTFTMLVYHPTLTGSTRLQFDGPGATTLKLNVDYSTPGAWQLLTWVVPQQYDDQFTQVMLVFAHNQAEAGQEWYFDELRGTPTNPVVGDHLFFDFEGDAETNPVWTESSASFLGVVSNPMPDALNSSDSVGLMTTSAVDWDGIRYDFSQPIDLSGDTIFTMLVYHPDSTGSIRLQFDGAGMSSLKLNVDYSTPGAWQLLTWRVPSQYDDLITKVLLVFDHNNGQPGGADAADVEEWYFDELRGAAENAPPDFTPAKTYFSSENLRKEWEGFDAAVYGGIVDNPAPDDVYDGAHAGKAFTGNNGWSGMYYDLPAPIDFSVEQTFMMWVYSDSVGYVRVQLENPGGVTTKPKLSVLYDTPGQWKKLVFTEADNVGDPMITDTYDRVILIFDDKDTDVGEEWYFDKLLGPDILDLGPYYNYFDYESEEKTPNITAPSWGSVVYGGKVANPHPDDVNSSDNVGLWISGNVNWHYAEWKLDRTIDFSESYTFTMKVFNADSTGNARIQLDDANGLNLKMSVPYTTPGQWQELTFSPFEVISNSTGQVTDDSYLTVKLIFDDEDGDIEEYWYFDDMNGPGLTPVYYINTLFTVTSQTGSTDYTLVIDNDGNTIQLYDDGTNGDVTAGDNIWSVFVAGLPEGDHVYDIYADGTLIEGGDFTFNLPMTNSTVEVPYTHIIIAVTDLSTTDFTIYPNPAKNMLNVRMSLQDEAEVNVHDLLGNLIINKQIDGSRQIFSLNTNDLIPGIYFISVSDQNGHFTTQKFVKQ